MTDELRTPLRARGCRCDVDEPFGDLLEGSCQLCGHQAEGRPILMTKTGGKSRQPAPPPPMVLHGRRGRPD